MPLSVRNVLPSLSRRKSAGPGEPAAAAAASIFMRVAASPNGTTSIGKGKRPSVGTHLLSSAMTIMRAEAAATIFSRSSAPPPPLISVRSGPISSAPSMVRSSSGVSSNVVSGMPRLSACARVASEVGTPITLQPSRMRSASKSRKCFTVEPVPRPSRIPGCTNCTARAAASRFCASASIGVTAGYRCGAWF